LIATLSLSQNDVKPNAKPTFPFILSITSGVLIIIGSIVSIIFRVIIPSLAEEQTLVGMLQMSSRLIIIFSFLGLLFGLIVIYSALKLRSNPERNAFWGTLIIIFSVLSLIGSWAGIGLGLIFGVIGGLTAIAWRPDDENTSDENASDENTSD